MEDKSLIIIVIIGIMISIIGFIKENKNSWKWYRKLNGGTWYAHWNINSLNFDWNRLPIGYSFKEEYKKNKDK